MGTLQEALRDVHLPSGARAAVVQADKKLKV